MGHLQAGGVEVCLDRENPRAERKMLPPVSAKLLGVLVFYACAKFRSYDTVFTLAMVLVLAFSSILACTFTSLNWFVGFYEAYWL